MWTIIPSIGRLALQGLAAVGLVSIGSFFGDDEEQNATKSTGSGWLVVLGLAVGVVLTFFLTRKK